MLDWDYDDQGEWVARSALKDADGDALYQYRVQVCGDGTFDTNASDGQLLPPMACVATLADAQGRCERREAEVRRVESDTVIATDCG